MLTIDQIKVMSRCEDHRSCDTCELDAHAGAICECIEELAKYIKKNNLDIETGDADICESILCKHCNLRMHKKVNSNYEGCLIHLANSILKEADKLGS